MKRTGHRPSFQRRDVQDERVGQAPEVFPGRHGLHQLAAAPDERSGEQRPVRAPHVSTSLPDTLLELHTEKVTGLLVLYLPCRLVFTRDDLRQAFRHATDTDSRVLRNYSKLADAVYDVLPMLVKTDGEEERLC